MDRVMGKLPNTSSRLIAMAVSLVGDGAQVLDRLIGLIVHEQGKMIAHNRELIAAVRKRRHSG